MPPRSPTSHMYELQVASEVERFWLRKSVTIHAAPVIARFSALPAQLISLWGSANGAGSHTSNPKPISIAVSNRDVRRAERPDSSAMAASANAIVVVIAQNICPEESTLEQSLPLQKGKQVVRA